MHWDYKVINIKPKTTGLFRPQPDNTEFEAMLIDLGRQGWELVQCRFPSTYVVGSAVLKRPK